jgi:DNA-binding CsgD family transcriptional regulator
MKLPDLVGRDAELARALALLDDAADERAVVALIGGDAGVGKSRLTEEIASLAAGRGFTVLTGQCAQIGDSVPYLPLADALRSPAARDAVAARPMLGWLLPETGSERPAERDGAGLARQQMFGAVLGLLAELSENQPLLLVLEDLHWADASTRALLTFLSRVLHSERVVIVGTYRTDDLHRRHPLLPVLAELRRLPTVTAIDLGPLASTALAAHLSSLMPNDGRQLDAATLNSFVERSEGNAYYAEELLAASERETHQRPVPDASLAEMSELPDNLVALLLSRVEQVSDEAQRVLRAAAVAGRQGSDDKVRAASGLSDAEFDHAIREAVAHQLLVPALDGYRFRHALLREAVYNDLLPGERTRLHATFAALLANGSPAELAYHCLASHDIPGALAASVRAGGSAERMAAPAEAHRHYEEALGLWERVPDAAELAGISRLKLAFRSASTAADSGDVPRAVQQFRRVWSVLPPDTDPEMRARFGERLAYYLLQLDKPGAASEAVSVAREVVAGTPSEPPSWYRGRAMATLASALAVTNESGQALDWADRARAAARESGSPWVEADALVTLGMLMSRGGNANEAVALLTAAHDQARETGVLGVELRAAYHLASTHLSRGDLATAAAVAHQGVLRAEQTGLGLAPFGMDVQHLHFQATFAMGEWDHAGELAAGFPIRVTSLPEAALSAVALFIDVGRGNPIVAERRYWLQPYSEDEFVAYISHGVLAEHELWRGDIDLALAEADAAIELARDPDHGPTPSVVRIVASTLWALGERARELRIVGDTEAVASVLERCQELLAIAREGAAFRYRPKYVLGPEGLGWLARADAEYARAAGKNDPKLWRIALDRFGPAYRYEGARTRWRLAESLAEAGARDEAAAELSAAREVAVSLGARPLLTAIDDLARRARLALTPDPHATATATATAATTTATAAAATTSPDKSDISGLAALTEREREVLDLLTAGRSNREIAAELFISPKTASVHVSNILGKLGAASRSEAAALARRAATAI